MIKNVIIYKNFDGKESMLPFDGSVKEVNFGEIVSFTRINQVYRNDNGAPMTDSYVIGIPYVYYNTGNPYYTGVRLKNDILNNGKQVSEREANYYFDMLTGDVCYKAPNMHIVSSQNELLGILKQFIEENKQVISEPQRPISKVRK